MALPRFRVSIRAAAAQLAGQVACHESRSYLGRLRERVLCNLESMPKSFESPPSLARWHPQGHEARARTQAAEIAQCRSPVWWRTVQALGPPSADARHGISLNQLPGPGALGAPAHPLHPTTPVAAAMRAPRLPWTHCVVVYIDVPLLERRNQTRPHSCTLFPHV